MKDASVHGSLRLYAMDLCGYNLGGDAGVVLDTVHELNDNLLSLCDFYEESSLPIVPIASFRWPRHAPGPSPEEDANGGHRGHL